MVMFIYILVNKFVLVIKFILYFIQLVLTEIETITNQHKIKSSMSFQLNRMQKSLENKI